MSDAERSYRLEVHEDPGWVELAAEPTVTLAALTASQVEIETLARESGLSRILVDARPVTAAPSLPELLAFGKALLGSESLRACRFALVGLPTGGLPLPVLRGVIRSAGVTAELFDGREEALPWLLGED